jgi:sugar O-acyltransferase (sialic acid O-acetyltransferase NeuD family)
MKPPKELILIGGGGHCKACIDVIEQEGYYEIKGILDTYKQVGSKVLEYEVLGSDDELDFYISQSYSFLITIGQVKFASLRSKVFQKLLDKSAHIATVISPRSYVSRYASIKEGTIVMHGAIINAEVEIDQNCIINNLCNIDHESKIGKNCHISTCSVINGSCTIGDGVLIGSSSVIIQGIQICKDSIIGAGCIVLNNIELKGTYVGNPLRKIK